MRTSFACFAVVAMCGIAGAATTYNNFPSWDGNITTGWFGQAERFPVPAVDNVLLSWTSQFDLTMVGMQVGFSITDIVGGVPGGNTYYSANPIIGATGIVSLGGINAALVSGQDYAAVWDFNGYSGPSIYWTANNVVPGNGLWRDQSGLWTDYPDFDAVLTAEFGVPAPGVAGVFGLGAVAMLRRRR